MSVWVGLVFEYWLLTRNTRTPAINGPVHHCPGCPANSPSLTPLPGGLGALEASQVLALQSLGLEPYPMGRPRPADPDARYPFWYRRVFGYYAHIRMAPSTWRDRKMGSLIYYKSPDFQSGEIICTAKAYISQPHIKWKFKTWISRDQVRKVLLVGTLFLSNGARDGNLLISPRPSP